MQPRDYQAACVAEASTRLADRDPPALYVAPTGSGKGLIEALLLKARPQAVLTVPSLSIGAGVFAKLTGDSGITEASEAAQRRNLEASRIVTVKRALSLASEGRLRAPEWIDDESHHATDDTHDSLRDLWGSPPHVGFTATPYRGTPAGTADLLKRYPGGVRPVLSLGDAVKRGYVSLPEFKTLPLLDDETISVTGGEFVVSAVESATRSRVGQLCDVLAARYSEGFYDRPVTVVLGSVGAVGLVAEAMAARSLPAVSVTATTRGRGRLFGDTVARRAVLLQVRAVGEGVDLPLRVMYDLSPTMSPVLWMQRVGRVMRPFSVCSDCGAEWRPDDWRCCSGHGVQGRPVYFSCCHNLMRHGYLFEGLIPRAAFTESRTAWGDDWEPSRRSMTRALGNTGFGRFHPVEVRLKGGGAAFLYALRAADGLRSYAALLLPHLAKPLYFGREDALTGRELEWTTPSGHAVKYPEKKVGRWTPLAELPDLEGCLSYPNDAMFPWKKQKWEREADARGLDAAAEVTRKTYTLLEILRDTNKRIPC
jgi:hypothetical protein